MARSGSSRLGQSSGYNPLTVTQEVAGSSPRLQNLRLLKAARLTVSLTSGRVLSGCSFPPNTFGLYDMHGNVLIAGDDAGGVHFFRAAARISRPKNA
jgi:hypothetical protein